MSRHAKSACPQGHAFTPENTRHMPNGYRRCKTCERERSARNSEQFKGGTGHRVTRSTVDRSVNV